MGGGVEKQISGSTFDVTLETLLDTELDGSKERNRGDVNI